MNAYTPNTSPNKLNYLRIIAGSVTGTALTVSRYLRDKVAPSHSVKLHEYPDLNEILTDPGQLLLFCVSNTGAGELPPVMRKVWVQLTEQKWDLSGHGYLIINFGDRSYREYGLSGKLLDDALRRSGAKRLSPRLTVDALVDPAPSELCWQWLQKELTRHQLL